MHSQSPHYSPGMIWTAEHYSLHYLMHHRFVYQFADQDMDYSRETTRSFTSCTHWAKSAVEARKIIIMMLSVNPLGAIHSMAFNKPQPPQISQHC